MCQWKFLVFTYSAKVSASNALRAPDTSSTACSDRSVGVLRRAADARGSSFLTLLLLTGNLMRLGRGEGRRYQRGACRGAYKMIVNAPASPQFHDSHKVYYGI